MRLLLVEDDVMVASGIKLGLTDAGYAVDWVGSGERAEEVLRWTENWKRAKALLRDLSEATREELLGGAGRAGGASRWP